MKSFAQMYDDMYLFGFLGVYFRLSSHDDKDDLEKSLLLTSKACGIAAYLNRVHGLSLPETEHDLFHMFTLEAKEAAGELNDELKEELKSSMMFNSEPLLEEISDQEFVISDEGHDLLEMRLYRKSADAEEPLYEVLSQKIFKLIVNSDNYVQIRLFLTDRKNTVISVSPIEQTSEQRAFIREYKELFELAYVKVEETVHQCCSCGLPVRKINGRLQCMNPRCKNEEKNRKQLSGGSYYVLNETAARYIFIPGILEMKIKEVLEDMCNAGIARSFELWPGLYGYPDTWDFSLELCNGKKVVIDAKDVSNPAYLIHDNRETPNGTMFYYVVPDDRTKDYVKHVNNEINDQRVCCVKVGSLKKELEALSHE